jgi:hypothetical protein
MSTIEKEVAVGRGAANKGERLVYFFGNGKAEGSGDMKDVLGGKGAGLAEMTNAGVPVPPGFTITTSVRARCRPSSRPSRMRRSPASSRRSARRSATRPIRCSSRSARAPSSRCPA